MPTTTTSDTFQTPRTCHSRTHSVSCRGTEASTSRVLMSSLFKGTRSLSIPKYEVLKEEKKKETKKLFRTHACSVFMLYAAWCSSTPDYSMCVSQVVQEDVSVATIAWGWTCPCASIATRMHGRPACSILGRNPVGWKKKGSSPGCLDSIWNAEDSAMPDFQHAH